MHTKQQRLDPPIGQPSCGDPPSVSAGNLHPPLLPSVEHGEGIDAEPAGTAQGGWVEREEGGSCAVSAQ